MTIWKTNSDLETLNKSAEDTMVSTIGIRFTEIGDDFLRGTMPVNEHSIQPFGLLHGGASAALAETLGSTAGQMCVDAEKYRCVGLELNANHIRSMTSGTVTGTARPKHIGRSTHVWEIEITNEQNKLVCISRLTLSILEL